MLPTKAIKKKHVSGTPGKVLQAEYFYYDTSPKFNKRLAIVCGGIEQCSPEYDVNRSNYPYYFAKYTIEGKGTLEINEKTIYLKPGILTGFEPGTAHHYHADANDPMKHIFVTFMGNQASELFCKSTLAKEHFIDVANFEETFSYFQKILQTGLKRPEYSQELCCNYLRILLLEQASGLFLTKKNISVSMSTYQECKKFIDNHFSTIKSPNEVAETCNINVRYMSSLFKRHGQIPPSQYLMRLKLNKAAYLLLTTDLSVKEVAFEIGFEDQYHFSKNFKQFHRMAPLNYRKEHMQNSTPSEDEV